MRIEYRLAVPPTVEPVTLQEAKAWLRVDHDAEDALIQLLIVTARERCESVAGLSLMSQQWVAYLPYWPLKAEDVWWDGVRDGVMPQEPCKAIPLRQGPVKQIDAVKLFDREGGASLYPSDYYALDRVRSRLVLLPGAPIPRGERAINPIEISYITGFETPPGAIRAGLLKLVAHLYEHRGDEAWPLPRDIETLWRPYGEFRL